MDYSQDLKRKIVQDHTDMNTAKRPATAQPPLPFDAPMPHNNPYSMSAPPSTSGFEQSSPHPSNDANIPRCKSPPLGMTLAHFDPASGGYATSLLKSEENVSAPICSGMTPAYRPPIERWVGETLQETKSPRTDFPQRFASLICWAIGTCLLASVKKRP